jgi:PAS domain S-box-containing protein
LDSKQTSPPNQIDGSSKKTPAEESPAEAIDALQQENQTLRKELAELRGMVKVLMEGPDPLIIEDISGRVVKLNAEAERFYGWQMEELIGQPVKLLIPPEQHPLADDLRDRCCQGEELRNIPAVYCNHRQEPVPVLLTLLCLTDTHGDPLGIVTIAKDLRPQRQLEKEQAWFYTKLQEQVEHTRRLASALTLAEQQDRSRISRILYDDLQQLLFGLLIRLELLDFRFAAHETPEFQKQFEQVIRGISQVIDTTRTLVVELAPPVLESEGLEEALHWLIGHMEEIYHLKIYLSIQAQPQLHNSNIQILLLRVVRELLMNVIQHSGAHQVQLTLSRRENELIIEIKDEGQGFDARQVRNRQKRRKDSGLFKIESWLDLIGGHLEIDAAPGQGARMTVAAPLV